MRGTGRGETDHLGDVAGGERGQAGVGGVGAFLIAVETHQRELRLHHAGADLGEPHRFSEQLVAQGTVQHALGVLGRGVAAAVVVDIERGDRGDRDDQAVAGGDQGRKQRLGQPQRAHHIGLPHPAPVVEVGLGHRRESLGSAGVVDEQIDPVESVDEGGDRRLVGDIELPAGAADLGGERGDPVDAAGTDHDVIALRGEHAGRGRTDPRTRAGHHRDLAAVRPDIQSC